MVMKKALMRKTNVIISTCNAFCQINLISRQELFLVPALILVVLLSQLVAGCSRLKLPPVTSPPTGVHHQGKFVWFDLLTDDVSLAKNFYGELFGWDFKKRGSYTVILNNGQAIGGMVKVQPKEGEKGTARWIPLLSVDDVDQAVAFVQKAGGTIHEGPVDMPKRGRGALINDPREAPLLLLHSLGGDPPDRDPPLGSWLWIELWTDTPEDSLRFYEELGDYNSFTERKGYWILERDEKWRGGIRSVPHEEGFKTCCWIPVVRVSDATATSQKAQDLGGQVLFPPRDTNDGGSVSLIEDPAGALLIVQRWVISPSATGE
jgi:predicted enzyme related to lactoylglutathione lyase